MKHFFKIGSVLILGICITSCMGQVTTETPAGRVQVGGAFENAEWTYEGIPKVVNTTDTSAGWTQDGQKILLTGIVYAIDGKTPVPDVLLYYYQTNTEGRYVHIPEVKGSMPPNAQGQTHGYIRGWVKSDAAGRYAIYTVRPGTYPANDEPAHIHMTIKEPNHLSEYYIDDVVFDDDRLVTSARRKRMENRGGSGVLRLTQEGDMYVGERDIILGLHIPGYPSTQSHGLGSGRSIGEDVLSFMPFHAWGVDIGTRTCPVCKYGRHYGVLYFVGNNPDWNEVRQWLVLLEQESSRRDAQLKVFFIYGNEMHYSKSEREHELAALGRELNLSKVALTFVPSFSDRESEVDLNRINPEAENTFLIYKRSRVIDKYVNLKPDRENFDLIAKQLGRI